MLWKVAEATSSCPNTLKIMEAIKTGKDVKMLPADHPGKAMAGIWNELSIESTIKGEVLVANQKLFIPNNIRRELFGEDVAYRQGHLGLACNKT